MTQPPGCSGVQALIYSKILPYLEANGWEFHFVGPAPRLTSVLTEDVQCPPNRLHYTNHVSWSRRFSVFKNRQPKKSFAFYVYGLLQFFSRTLEKLLRHHSLGHLTAGLQKTITAADSAWDFDLIAGKSPDFMILKAVARLTKDLKKPLVAMIVDPYGKRDGNLFIPYELSTQAEILEQCCGAMFMSPLTCERYIQSGLVGQEKAYSFTDSYPSSEHLYLKGMSSLPRLPDFQSKEVNQCPIHMVHLGMLPEWRPIETLLEAIESLSIPVFVDFFGYVYPAARQTIQSNSSLCNRIRCNKAVGYEDSHLIAEDCSVLLVIIGPRHLDNQPSKFFEYLGHRKPLLVLGPPGNPIEGIVNNLGIGVYCDILNRDSIIDGINKISNQYSKFVSTYDTNNDKIEIFSASKVAKHWRDCLDKMLSASSEV
ncbi:MAG: hypothetical protein ACOYNM_19645 [Gemmataceae bacterium]